MLKEKLIGSWQLLTWTYKKNGETHNHFGENPEGILMYDNNGKMNAQLVKKDRKKFSSEGLNQGLAEEMCEAFKSYLAYYGSFKEINPGEIVHTVEGSLFPNWVGQEQFRYGKLENNILTFTTQPILSDGEELIFEVTWRRIGD